VVAVLVDKLRQNAAGRRARPTGPGAGEPRAAVGSGRA
jgi:hypothetical protein